MIEVFKTDVVSEAVARQLVATIAEVLEGCRANFDLEDCDRILRVCRDGAEVDAQAVIGLLEKAGYRAEVLEDVIAQAITS